jgi:hypothetical protein
MKKKIDKHYAPPGCIAVRAPAYQPCTQCVFCDYTVANAKICNSWLCLEEYRRDGRDVIFKRILPLHILIGKILAVLKEKL